MPEPFIDPPAYGVVMYQIPSFSPGDGSVYWGAGNFGFSRGGESGASCFFIPFNGVIEAVYIGVCVLGTLGTTETINYTLVKNGTDTSLVISGISTSGLNNGPYSITGGSITCSPTDRFSNKFVCPTWATNPTTVTTSYSLKVRLT